MIKLIRFRPDIAELSRLYQKEKFSVKDIAKKYGVNTWSVIRCLHVYEIPIKTGFRFERIDLERKYWFEGKTQEEIAKEVSCSRKQVGRELVRLGIPRRKSGTRFGTKFTTDHRKNMSGPNAGNWRGGRIKENERLRKSAEYVIWRREVYRRDRWTCRFCGAKGRRIHADHILPWSLFPDFRYDVSNGRTLCIDCHKKTDTFMAPLLDYPLNFLGMA